MQHSENPEPLIHLPPRKFVSRRAFDALRFAIRLDRRITLIEALKTAHRAAEGLNEEGACEVLGELIERLPRSWQATEGEG